jgi:hypothetical protein
MEDVGIFYGHLVYFTTILYIFIDNWCIFDNLIYFSRFGKLHQEKSGNPGDHQDSGAFRLSLRLHTHKATDFT